MEKKLTTGSVFKNITYSSLPYLLSYLLQTLYGMVDLFIIGQFNGVAQITAVSIGSQVMHMLTVMIVGLAMGSTVTIGKAVGTKHSEHAFATIGNTVTLLMRISAAITALLLLFSNKKLFQIGDVAKMFHISVGSLRHYEQAGLLKPEYIDEIPDIGIAAVGNSRC